MGKDKTMIQILEVFSDGKSHSLEAVAKRLRLSYNKALHYLRKLEAQGKLHCVSRNSCYKLGK